MEIIIFYNLINRPDKNKNKPFNKLRYQAGTSGCHSPVLRRGRGQEQTNQKAVNHETSGGGQKTWVPQRNPQHSGESNRAIFIGHIFSFHQGPLDSSRF
jgi:hypothetical protein